MPAGCFQIKLGGAWKDYSQQEDKILKRSFLAGYPNARYKLRGSNYEISFEKMTQSNQDTGKTREIRPPYKWTAPKVPITPPGPTMCVKVPPGAPGTVIQVPHPKNPAHMIDVDVPATAKVGQAMLVPVPEIPAGAETPAAGAAPAASGGGGWSTGGKVAAGAAGIAAEGGLAVAGAILGEHIAEDGWDATMADLGDAADGVGEGIGDAAEAAGDWIGDAAGDAGDALGDAGGFIMDLF
jgi:hypothetical protein